jgi:hypothetical protein
MYCASWNYLRKNIPLSNTEVVSLTNNVCRGYGETENA